ncbi:MAG: tetratricopeptide repeat protein [Nitrospina sp.]|nr:tetratricopeptide repeat protein [Nitrospina sp.]
MKIDLRIFKGSRSHLAGNYLTQHGRTLLTLFFILFVIVPINALAQSVDTQIQQGIKQYNDGEFKDAGESFALARSIRPEDSRIAYNQGNSHYRNGNFQEALKAFNHAALDENNPALKKSSLYNTGNTLVKLEKLEEAESVFKKVLALDSTDMDAKYNLEYVRDQLKKKEQQEQQKNKDSDKNSDKKSDKDSDKKEKGDKEQDPEGDADEDSQAEAPPATPEKEAEQKQEPEETSAQAGESELEISEAEAEKMLNRLSEDLKSISRLQAGKTKSTYQGNDW